MACGLRAEGPLVTPRCVGLSASLSIALFVFGSPAHAACPAADIGDGDRRAVWALEELKSLHRTYDEDRANAFEAIRKSSFDVDEQPVEPLEEPLHVGASYVLSASLVDLCRESDRGTTGTLVRGGVFAVETERWAFDVMVGERRVFAQHDETNEVYRGFVFSGTARYRQWLEASAGVMTPEVDVESPTRGYLVTSIPGSHVSQTLVLSGASRPVASTYLDADEVRFWKAPIALSARLGYLDVTRQGYADVGIALVLPALRLGAEGSTETNAVRPRYGRWRATLGGTHTFSRLGAYVSGGLTFAMSRYMGSSIRSVGSRTANGFEIGLFAGAGLPWIAMGAYAKVGQNDPERLAIMPASYGNGDGSVSAIVRVTPHVHRLPKNFRTLDVTTM